MFDEFLNKNQAGCERITEEEFEFQARILTKQEIRKLVTSPAYERVLAAKGKDPANWNWQLHDKQEGFFPTNEEEVKDGDADLLAAPNALEKSFFKIDEDLKREGRAQDSVRRALNGLLESKKRQTR